MYYILFGIVLVSIVVGLIIAYVIFDIEKSVEPYNIETAKIGDEVTPHGVEGIWVIIGFVYLNNSRIKTTVQNIETKEIISLEFI